MNVSEQQSIAQTTRTKRIVQLNDKLRKTGIGGQVVVTRGVGSLDGFDPAELMLALSQYHQFDEDNDPHGEHDFGDIDFCGAELLWKIDYYDPSLTYASPDPTDAAVTARVLTIMLAEEY